MNNEIEIFTDVRIITEDDTFVLVATDVAKVWNYSTPGHLLRLLDDSEIQIREVDVNLSDGRKQRRKVQVITEKGLNRLVSTLRRPELKEWQDKLYGEIIPTYNRTGMAIDTDRVDLSDPETVLSLAARAGELASKYKAERDLAEEKVVELTPKADRYDHFMNTDETKSIREVARMLRPYGVRERVFIEDILREDWGWIDKVGTAAKVYAIDRGYLSNKVVYKPTGDTITQGRFTKKGIDRAFHKLGLGSPKAAA
ncbi:phage antirepressor KilAC domain-containing protein [Acrocarpospora sp. B8E8]|uniref:phage antirepressor KilAC domain-containing protein n=1 Tax=Acrocarpospora sp. B8E8 TaxID=3153572 RepID=UPI00325EF38B